MQLESAILTIACMGTLIYMQGMRAYHWNPSLQRIIELELFTIVYFEDELVGELREGDTRVGIEFLRVLGEVREGWSGGKVWRFDARHDCWKYLVLA